MRWSPPVAATLILSKSPVLACSHGQAIVRIAITRYIKTGEIADVSDAIAQCGEDMEAYLPPEAKQASDLFRERYCYNQQVDDVLMAHMTTIRSLYDSYSTANDHRAAINSARLLSVGEWSRLMKVACGPRSEERAMGCGVSGDWEKGR